VDLTVVIPTHNKLSMLQRTLAALGRQEAGLGRKWEVVVVNDGSSDGTAAWLSDSASGIISCLHVVTASTNVGRARARNLGVYAAKGRWILFIDDDIVAPPGLLAAHLDLLDANPGYGTIGWARTDNNVRDAPHFHYLDTRGAARLSAGKAPAGFFVTQNAAVAREALLAVGGFNEDFKTYGFEDVELAFRLEKEVGMSFLTISTPVPSHIHHCTLKEYFARKVEAGASSLPIMAATHPDRMVEMRLESVLGGGGVIGFCVRIVADTPLADRLQGLLAVWPRRSDNRPLAEAFYRLLMNLAVICCFRRGWLAQRTSV